MFSLEFLLRQQNLVRILLLKQNCASEDFYQFENKKERKPINVSIYIIYYKSDKSPSS